MPGPGQGKQGQKKKWRESAHSKTDIAAVNNVMNIGTLTARTDPLANEMAPPTTIATTTAYTAANNANDTSSMTNVNANMAVLSPVNLTPDTSSSTYSHEEVHILLEEAKLDGWQEGYEEGSKKLMEGYRDGYEARRKLEDEKEERDCKEGQLEGYKLGIQQWKDKE